ncbi:transposase, partial [Enterococcus faecium]
FAELIRLGLPLNYSNLKLVSRVPGQVLPVLISFFEWDLEEFVKKGVDPDIILKSTGLTRKWEGPPGYDGPLGGYAYRP